jgi:Ca2+-transporting ATPase
MTDKPIPQTTTTHWHTFGVEEITQRLDVRPEAGLSEAEVETRLGQSGTNELIEQGLKHPLVILWEQLTATMVIVLIVAAVIAFFLGETKSVIAIMAIVILNALLGFTQEYRAEQAMVALRRMAAPTVRARRGGLVVDVEARRLVPGDVILLEAGSVVPADARLIEAANLRVQEASLTGESLPVDKNTLALGDEGAPLGDRHNMLYMGTAVTYGRGAAVVTETGMRTELGKIASLIQNVAQEKTPLQKRMTQLGNVLAVAAFVIVALAFGIGVLRGEQPAEMLLNAVAIAVAVVPEGLPAVVTIALALGAQRMLKRRALIRKLPAVETLGSVTVICSDKTGTLTENRMTVKILDVAGHSADVIEVVRGVHAMLEPEDKPLTPAAPELRLLLAGGALCNDALLQGVDEKPGEFSAIGDPTEGALLVAAARFGLWKNTLETMLPRVGEVPFSSER